MLHLPAGLIEDVAEQQRHEFQVRGRAREVTDATARAAVASAWSFEVDDGYRLFEFGIEHAVFGERASADDWPPVYTSWRTKQ